MKISYEWLKEYVDVRFSPGELAEKLTMLGFEASFEGETAGHRIIDVEVTSNRPDCLCMLGLARELSALTSTKLKFSETAPDENGDDVAESVQVTLASELCPRYCARVITGIKVEPSPPELRKKLEAVGIRSVNNVVDITNYVLMEMGHPMHAFDLELLKGRKVIVRGAERGEKIITIDGVERNLEPWMLVIADEKKPVAIAGIMGGLHSEVTAKTGTVLLESACFDPSVVRKTSKTLQLETESSYRFQRRADIEGTVPSIDRAAGLIQEIAGGMIAKGIIDCFPVRAEGRKVPLRLSRANRILGMELSSEYAEKTLCALGFGVERHDMEFTVSIPGFRRDVEREIDLIEEIARLYSYDRIPSTIPAGRISPGSEDKFAKIMKTVCKTLTGSGLTEVINHGLINENWLENFDLPPAKKVVNPLSEEQSVLRQTLIPGMLETLRVNISRGVRNVRIFELGNVYDAGKGEKLSLGGAVMGSRGENWSGGTEKADFYDLKGVLENLFEGLKIVDWTLVPYNGRTFASAESAVIKTADCELGVIGKVSDKLLEQFGIDGADEVYVFELSFPLLADNAGVDIRFKTLPKYPASFRDIAVVVPDEVKYADLVSVIMDEGEGIVEKVELFDIYRGDQVREGCKSMAFSITYRMGGRTLKDDEVNKLHEKISGRVTSQFNGHIRA